MKRQTIWATIFSTWVVVTCLLVGAPAISGAGSGPPQASPAAPPTQQQGYIGAEACATCHEGYDRSVEGTKHGFKANPRTPMAQQGCETCHGPGGDHVNDPEKVKPRQFNKAPTAEANAVCTTCHDRAKHVLWEGS